MGIRERVKSRPKLQRKPLVDQKSTFGSSSQTSIREDPSADTSPTLQRSDSLPLDGSGSENHCTQDEEQFLFEITLPGITLYDSCAVEDHNEERTEASRFSNPSMAGPSMHVDLGSPNIKEPSSYPSHVLRRSQSLENPLDGCGSQNCNTQYEGQFSSEDPVYGIALYDFFAGDHNGVLHLIVTDFFGPGIRIYGIRFKNFLMFQQALPLLNLTVGEEFEIEYEVDGWYHLSVQKLDIFYEKEPYLCCLSKPI